jgi:uncharacterized protein YukE
MAAGQLNVEPQGMQRAGTGISSAAGQLRGQVSSFQQELAGYGQPWGNDMVGSLIGMCYQVISGAAMQSITDNVSGLDDHGQRVQAMASVYAESESASTVEANRVRQALG